MTSNSIKKNPAIIAVLALFVSILLTIALVMLFNNSKRNIADCRQTPITEAIVHQVDFSDEGFAYDKNQFQQCDRLLIVNNSSDRFQVAFGEHNNHDNYPGFQEAEIGTQDFAEIVLYKHGEFEIHNHFNEARTFSFTVGSNDELSQYSSLSKAIKYDSESYNPEHEEGYHNE